MLSNRQISKHKELICYQTDKSKHKELICYQTDKSKQKK